MLKALFGLIKIREGTVCISGEDVPGKKANFLVEKGIGYVPQLNNVFPSLTIGENLEMGGSCRKQVKRDDRLRHRHLSHGSPSGSTSGRGRCRAASARCWRWAVP